MSKAWTAILVAAIPTLLTGLFGLISDAKQNRIYQLEYQLALANAGKEDLASKVAVAESQAPKPKRAGRAAGPSGSEAELEPSLAGRQVGALAEADSVARATRPATRRVTVIRRGWQLLSQALSGKAGN